MKNILFFEIPLHLKPNTITAYEPLQPKLGQLRNSAINTNHNVLNTCTSNLWNLPNTMKTALMISIKLGHTESEWIKYKRLWNVLEWQIWNKKVIFRTMVLTHSTVFLYIPTAISLLPLNPKSPYSLSCFRFIVRILFCRQVNLTHPDIWRTDETKSSPRLVEIRNLQ